MPYSIAPILNSKLSFGYTVSRVQYILGSERNPSANMSDLKSSPESLTISDTFNATQGTLHSSSTDKKDASSDSQVGVDEENYTRIRTPLGSSSDSFGTENNVGESESSYESSASRMENEDQQKSMFYFLLDDSTNDLDSSLDIKGESSYYSVPLDMEETVDGFM